MIVTAERAAKIWETAAGELEVRVKALEVALRAACAMAQSYMDCDIPFPPDEDRDELARLRALAGEL